MSTQRFTSFRAIYPHLMSTHPAPLLPPSKPHFASLVSQIAALQVHPTLEAALHILNADLPSAHFLEGAELYTRIWDGGGVTFKDLDEGVRETEFGARRDYGRGGAREGELDAGQRFLNAVQAFKETKAAARGVEEGEGLERESRREIETVVEWCVEKFGTGTWADASDAWVRNSEEVQKMSDEMVGGDKGRRKF
ncbi:hypothetical protein BUE80_DR010894 [Diplocarpon rosae]|nr:hypothetical protein BUE80_DR010894 [Diplocarpon rosae]